MKILLVRNVESLGDAGDAVNVADGFARNYLFPRKLAVPYSPGAVKMADQYRKNAMEKESKTVQDARDLAARLADQVFTIRASADENGHLYGGVSEREVAEEMTRAGFDIDRRYVLMDEHIKNVGEYRIELKIYGSIHQEIVLKVEPE